VALYKLDCYCYEYYNNLTMHLFETVHDYQETSRKRIEINQKVSSEKNTGIITKTESNGNEKHIFLIWNIFFANNTT